MERSACFDASGRYRYCLTRRWAARGATVAFVLLNPSTADANLDDPTLRRCIGFAKRWGYAGLEVVNLFAWRATRPADLRRARDPVGPENDAHLLAAAARAGDVVLAWGIHGTLLGRGQAVLTLLRAQAPRLLCLGRTRGGQPRHVLYLPGDLRPMAFPPTEGNGTDGRAREADVAGGGSGASFHFHFNDAQGRPGAGAAQAASRYWSTIWKGSSSRAPRRVSTL
jgi:hypothetical protein